MGVLATAFFWWCYVSVVNEQAINPIAEFGDLSTSLSSTEIDEHVHQMGKRFHDNNAACLVVIAVIGDQQKYYSFGMLPSGPPNENTVFELASVGKTFTALLLGDMVTRGEVRLEAKVLEVLPDINVPGSAPIAQVSLK